MGLFFQRFHRLPGNDLRLILVVMAVFSMASSAGAQGTFPLQFLPTGATAKGGSYTSQALTLSPIRPAKVTKVPSGVTDPLYCTFTFGSVTNKATLTVLLDDVPSGGQRLFVDSNADGDLTDDPAASWQPAPYQDGTGADWTLHRGEIAVAMPPSAGGVSKRVTMLFSMFDRNDPQKKNFKNVLMCLPDYGSYGRVTLAGKTYPIWICDREVAGDLSDRKNLSLKIDVNGDGHYGGASEQYAADKPFNIGGTTYEISSIAPDGRGVTLVKSSKSVAEIPPEPDLRVGKMAVPFTVAATDGTTIDLLKSYKGCLVLLDFWATWCIPCCAEQPAIVQAYQSLRDKGLDVLGISLDDQGSATKMADYAKAHGMIWPQIHDGKVTDGLLTRLYGISYIPRLLLVDGDTGRIVATDETFRGKPLAQALTEAVTHAMNRKTQAQSAAPSQKTASLGK